MKSLLNFFFILIIPFFLILFLINCNRTNDSEQKSAIELLANIGLNAEIISAENFYKGIEPKNFLKRSGGANYKPSYNPDPAIPPQCWIETGYGTQNACKYCHTDYLANIKHGNALKIAEDQILYSFPSAELNHILWRNIIFPEEIISRLLDEGIALPDIDELEYIRSDNWGAAFKIARGKGNTDWLNTLNNEDWILFPALNPAHLFPYKHENPTSGGKHGYIDNEGFVRSETNEYTGWRAINFFPYAIFTPLTGSVSGIYIRLPKQFMQIDKMFNAEVYHKNLNILEMNIKNENNNNTHYLGDASDVEVKKGFYPVGTEFAHPLHYVDLLSQGQIRKQLDGMIDENYIDYEFPGTRSKRVKEIRYMYKWKDVDLEELEDGYHNFEEGDFDLFIGNEGQGWIDNNAGWIIAGYIEDRNGNLRTQTTEELAQCLGCHGNVGNTVDAVWSFQRKLPGNKGWQEMNYGNYNALKPNLTKLEDYVNEKMNMGEFGYFLYSVVGADLYGVMSSEIVAELKKFVTNEKIITKYNLEVLFDDSKLKNSNKQIRHEILKERQKIMRYYAETGAYLKYNEEFDKFFIKGNIFYPSVATMKNNIKLYRQIVLDQSFNLGKDVFGTERDNVPFTFRSDGEISDASGKIISAGDIIKSRPFDKDGVGTTPTGIVKVNSDGEPIDIFGGVIDIEKNPEDAEGHISSGGTFDMEYNPILSKTSFRPIW